MITNLLSTRHVHKKFVEIDDDGNGYLDFEEFTLAVNRLKTEQAKQINATRNFRTRRKKKIINWS